MAGRPRDGRRGEDAQRGGVDPGGRALARLPGSGREIDAIAAIAADAVALRASGFEATREALLRLPLENVDVLHVATHASLDPAIPELAALELSRLDAAGRPLEGALRAAEVRRLRAAPALVVLAACDAAREPSAAADGLMNLVRAFLAARSRHVVASLWEVGDASAIELMSRFYTGLLQDGLAPDAALARAQRELAASPRWSAPVHWAGFVLTEAPP
jgi:CHAT domain-containing protein